jgi:hypothetical protein
MPAAENFRLRGNDAHAGSKGAGVALATVYTAELIMQIPYNGVYGWKCQDVP